LLYEIVPPEFDFAQPHLARESFRSKLFDVGLRALELALVGEHFSVNRFFAEILTKAREKEGRESVECTNESETGENCRDSRDSGVYSPLV
jgi:hypothetical protein